MFIPNYFLSTTQSAIELCLACRPNRDLYTGNLWTRTTRVISLDSRPGAMDTPLEKHYDVLPSFIASCFIIWQDSWPNNKTECKHNITLFPAASFDTQIKSRVTGATFKDGLQILNYVKREEKDEDLIAQENPSLQAFSSSLASMFKWLEANWQSISQIQELPTPEDVKDF